MLIMLFDANKYYSEIATKKTLSTNNVNSCVTISQSLLLNMNKYQFYSLNFFIVEIMKGMVKKKTIGIVPTQFSW
jgi:hypothetical protein